jgi:pantoate ligase / CMP/dCMP kinase
LLLLKTIAELQAQLQPQQHNKIIGLVPTMGALHIGHASLIKRAVNENDVSVVSIFVNPLQFSPNEDLERYPRQLQRDCELCEQLGVDLVFVPSTKEMYRQQPTTKVIPPDSMTSVLCGAYRAGHFEGVATIVTKLFHIVQPTNAYFGQKDAQQLAIIQRLVEDLNLQVSIKPCPIVREPSGLAYSSRNQYLNPQEREQALALSRSLRQAEAAFKSGDRFAKKLIEIVQQELALFTGIKVEYVELVHPQTLMPLEKIDASGLLAIACYVGSTRLIDNQILKKRQPIVAIDGPAGSGKSTVTRRVAQALGLLHLDTGAMYRAIAWLVMKEGISLQDEEKISLLVSEAKITLIPADSAQKSVRVYINGQEVTKEIRTSKVTANVSAIASIAAVRKELVKQQQLWGEKGGVVAEGRDIGTYVFPDAELKIFLTASVLERAKRRMQDLKEQGEEQIDLEQIEQDIQQRDYIDSNRLISPLQKAEDAIEVDTDGLSIEEVTNKIISLYKQRFN